MTALDKFPDLPAVGAYFDPERGGAFVTDQQTGAWKTFWRAVGPFKLRNALLYAGEIFLGGMPPKSVFCIAVFADELTVGEVRSALEQSAEFQGLAASPAFVGADLLAAEWTVMRPQGHVDAAGALVDSPIDVFMVFNDVVLED